MCHGCCVSMAESQYGFEKYIDYVHKLTKNWCRIYLETISNNYREMASNIELNITFLS